MHLNAHSSRRPTAWIISPVADIVLLLATPLAIVPAIYFASRYLSTEFIVIAVAAFASIGHHLPGFMRAYGDRELFRRFRWRFLLAPPLVLAAALYCESRKLHGLELILLVWATWHIIMQTYGLMRIYDLKRGIRDATSARLDFIVCVVVFVAGILFSQTRLFSILDVVGRVGLPLGPPATIAWLQWGFGIAAGAALIAYAIHVLIQTREVGPSWAKIALLSITGCLYWSCGSLSTNLLIGVAMFEVFHAVQYNALVWSYNRRLADRVGDRFGPLRFLFAGGWLPLTIYLALIFGFGSIKLFAEQIDPSMIKTVFLSFLVASTTLHFYYDGFIWKVSERGTQSNLGIESEGVRTNVVPGLAHLGKWAGLAVVAALLFWVEAAGTPQTGADSQPWTATLAQLTPDVPELLMRQSHMALAHGRISEAVAAAQRAVQARPSSAEAQAALGDSLLHAGRYPQSVVALRQAAALAPNEWENHFDLAEALGRSGQWSEADEQFAIAARMQPKNPKILRAWAGMCVRGGTLELAREHFGAALALAPDSLPIRDDLVQLLIRTGAKTEAVQIAAAMVARDPSTGAQLLLARSQVADGDFAGANESARQAVALAPNSAEANYQLGLINVQLRDFPTAEIALQQSLAANPDSAPTHLQMGNVYFLTQRPELAEQSFRRSIALSPETAEGHSNLGALLLQGGRIPQAKESLLEAIEINPNNAQSHYNLGLIYLIEGNLPDARSQLQFAERLGQPATPEIRRAAGL